MLEEVFSDGGWLSQMVDNYKFRPGQLNLAQAVEDALFEGHHLLADAPTGTGKSFAYGVPAASYALSTSIPVVIVTANITLQEQLIKKDLPTISRLLSGRLENARGETLPDLKFSLLKGMSNYVCKDKVEELESAGAEKEDWFREILKWYYRTNTGDKSELSVEYPPRIWGNVSSSSDECTKSSCKYYDACYALAGRRTTDAHIVVTNYHMLYTDITVRANTGGQVSLLPPHKVVIMDEGHEAVDIAQSFGGFDISRSKLKWMSRGMSKVHRKDAEHLMHALVGCTDNFFDRLNRMNLDDIIRKPIGFDAGIVGALKTSGKYLVSITGSEEEDDDKDVRKSARLKLLGGSMIDLASQISGVTEGIVSDDGKKPRLPAGSVFYVDRAGEGSGRNREARLCCKVVDVQGWLRQHIFSQKTLVVVSATLASGPSFKFVGREMGLAPSEYDTRLIESPFDPSRVLLVVPRGMPQPKDRDRHMSYVASVVAKVVRDLGGRTMALFTSYKSLRTTSDHLRSLRLSGVQVLVQGEMPKSRIIETFKRTDRSVILGTSSFWQGVDIPGQALSCLVIDKFPFLPPSDPVLKYMEDEAELEGRSAFFEYSVPKAVISLKQGVGRLIRTEKDYGVVVLCDNRIDTTGYGKQFRKAFPKGYYRSQEGDLDDVNHFLKNMGGS